MGEGVLGVERDASVRHASELLMRYIRTRVPKDAETGGRVTGNPLMLSMVCSIYESRQGREDKVMPETIAELYQVASSTMLQRVDRKERGAAASVANTYRGSAGDAGPLDEAYVGGAS